ncbi:hypothetical protein PF005_g8491 [Phytophthora fragariae]|uniref:Uncharacterized protein n=1 Tax=Phytophthora fragariae TaxID=53985 RepID=A0A6A3UGY3_9STRA|nr:hypothetical protein PF003_g18341 [Phytophthora fragariae]KAE9106117.1 hypothetical protein PF010_g12742 [Phytophthora fragariae]KAE9119580.1 hypothetical protein PF007_g8489 [Phytophthora fragariae]KAE9150417.1 hypothetical protein PF006_g5208 [Phytophthora fragariae]KAE9201098.1 hypothetical protein PF004_g18807 [Phytophthora fragariae]
MTKDARSINEYVEEKALEVMYVPSAENLAYIFTKALGPAEFERQRGGLNVEDVTKAWAEVAATAETVMTCASSSSEEVDIEMKEV